MQSNGKMSFGDFIFPVNPYLLQITHRKSLSEQVVPFRDSFVCEIGTMSRVVSGEGEFYGTDCEEVFGQLRALFEKGGGGMLYLPSQTPFFALFEELKLEARDLENVIRYRFRFRESVLKKTDPSRMTAVADGRKCLWDFASESGIGIAVLQKLNPDVRRPDEAIERGRRVFFC